MFHHHRNKNNSEGSYLTHLVIANLAFADFALGLIGTVTYSHANADFHTLGEVACSVYGAFLICIVCISIQLVLLLGYLRYRFLISRPYVNLTI